MLSWVVASLNKSTESDHETEIIVDKRFGIYSKCTYDLAICGTTSSGFGIVAAYDANDLLPKNLFIEEKYPRSLLE